MLQVLRVCYCYHKKYLRMKKILEKYYFNYNYKIRKIKLLLYYYEN